MLREDILTLLINAFVAFSLVVLAWGADVETWDMVGQHGHSIERVRESVGAESCDVTKDRQRCAADFAMQAARRAKALNTRKGSEGRCGVACAAICTPRPARSSDER